MNYMETKDFPKRIYICHSNQWCKTSLAGSGPPAKASLSTAVTQDIMIEHYN
jgi:hypothetical protein